MPSMGASSDDQFVEANTRERERLRALVDRLTEDDLRRPVTEGWNIAEMLGHVAFWDARAVYLGEKIEQGAPFSPADDEPDDVDAINGAVHALLRGLAPREVAQLASRLAEEADRLVSSVDPQRLWPQDPNSPLNPLRAAHRGEHLDQIESVLR